MDSFFTNRSHWSPQRPVHPFKTHHHSPLAPKVVSIPVNFVGYEPDRRGCSAVKIQKVLRGFLVRKGLKRIRDVRAQVDEIEERLSRSETVELVRRDGRERLRINEALMSLLFKLDSICGVDLGVRACRKAVIRRVIALQEKVDSIAAIDLEEIGDGIRVSEGVNGSVECCRGNLEGEDGEVEIVDVGVDREVKVVANEDQASCRVEEGNGSDDDNKRSRELLERLMEDNEKMMSLMTRLCERNEVQARMLNMLTHRVELLEKAFVCDRLRSQKNKNKKKKKKVPTMRTAIKEAASGED